MRIYLMRHSETDWNRQHRIQGRADVHLNQNGMQLAVLSGEGMADLPIDLCFTSPLSRARETAAIVLARNPWFIRAGAKIEADGRLVEIAFGEWEGRDSFFSGEGKDRAEFNEFFTHLDSDFCPAGAEPLRSVVDRSNAFLDDITNRKELQDKTLLVMTHGCTFRCMLYRFFQNEDYFQKPAVVYNCGTARIDKDADGTLTLHDFGRIFYDEALAVNHYA